VAHPLGVRVQDYGLKGVGSGRQISVHTISGVWLQEYGLRFRIAGLRSLVWGLNLLDLPQGLFLHLLNPSERLCLDSFQPLPPLAPH